MAAHQSLNVLRDERIFILTPYVPLSRCKATKGMSHKAQRTWMLITSTKENYSVGIAVVQEIAPYISIAKARGFTAFFQ